MPSAFEKSPHVTREPGTAPVDQAFDPFRLAVEPQQVSQTQAETIAQTNDTLTKHFDTSVALAVFLLHDEPTDVRAKWEEQGLYVLPQRILDGKSYQLSLNREDDSGGTLSFTRADIGIGSGFMIVKNGPNTTLIKDPSVGDTDVSDTDGYKKLIDSADDWLDRYYAAFGLGAEKTVPKRASRIRKIAQWTGGVIASGGILIGTVGAGTFIIDEMQADVQAIRKKEAEQRAVKEKEEAAIAEALQAPLDAPIVSLGNTQPITLQPELPRIITDNASRLSFEWLDDDKIDAGENGMYELDLNWLRSKDDPKGGSCRHIEADLGPETIARAVTTESVNQLSVTVNRKQISICNESEQTTNPINGVYLQISDNE